MSAVRASALFTFIRPAPPLRGISGEYITIKKLRPQVKKREKKGIMIGNGFVANARLICLQGQGA